MPADRERRQAIIASARPVSLDAVGRGLPKPDPVEGQEELPFPDRDEEER